MSAMSSASASHAAHLGHEVLRTRSNVHGPAPVLRATVYRRLEVFEPCSECRKSWGGTVLQRGVEVGTFDGQGRRRAVLGGGLAEGRLEIERDAFKGKGGGVRLAGAGVRHR